jgi:hypothetical protein
VDDVAAAAIQEVAQVVEGAGDVELRDIDMPVLVGAQGLGSGGVSGVELRVQVVVSPAQTAGQITIGLAVPDAAESTYLLLEHLAANSRVRIASPSDPGQATCVRT